MISTHEFIAERLEVTGDRRDFITKKQAYAAYYGWCQVNKKYPYSQSRLTRHVNAVLHPDRTRDGWTGLKLQLKLQQEKA